MLRTLFLKKTYQRLRQGKSKVLVLGEFQNSPYFNVSRETWKGMIKMKKQLKYFWTYDEVLGLFNYMSNDLSYSELKLLISIMKLRLSLKKKERTGAHV